MKNKRSFQKNCSKNLFNEKKSKMGEDLMKQRNIPLREVSNPDVPTRLGKRTRRKLVAVYRCTEGGAEY